MLLNENPYINNLNTIKMFKPELKIIIDGKKILLDERYIFQGLRRYWDESGKNNIKNIQQLIEETYNNIIMVLTTPQIDDIILRVKRNKLYILYLSSFDGLKHMCKKYNILEIYSYYQKKSREIYDIVKKYI